MQHPKPSFIPITLAASLSSIAAALPAQDSTSRVPTEAAPQVEPTKGETYVSPHEGRPVLLGGTDNAPLAPMGEVYYLPVETLPQGATDQDLQNAVAAPPVLRATHDRIYFTEHASGTWVRGATYKARVHESGFTYIPFLGSNAPRNYATSFRLASATLAGRALGLDQVASVSRDGDRFVLDRGPVDVVYDVALESVEQSFVLDVAGAAGDLVLELDVTSELQPAFDSGGFSFAGPHGGMNYGAAIVFDGAGRTADVPAELDGETMTLTVPAAFLAAAEGQIVVDPIIFTFTVDDFGGDQTEVDVAYDTTTDSFTYVFEDGFSGGDRDIFRTTVRPDGMFVNSGYIDSSSEDWTDPSIANLNSANSNLVVASRINATSGYREIVGRIQDVPGNSTGPELLIGDANASWENARPDVGGNSATSGGMFFVVWERRFSTTWTLARGTTVSATGMVSPFTALAPVGNDHHQQEIVISKSTGDASVANVWNVAMRQENLVTNTDTIEGVQLNASGSIINSANTLLTDFDNHRLREIDVSDAIDVDGQSFPTYLVTCDDYSSIGTDATLIVCRNNSRVRTIQLNEREHAIIARDQQDLQFSTTREDFVVTYLENDPTGPGFDVYCTALDLTEGNELAISERRTFLGSTVDGQGGPAAVASRFSGGNLGSRYTGVGFSQYDTVGGDFELEGVMHFASNGFAQAFQYCDGNPNSTGDRGFITMYGDRSTTSTKLLTATALPANSFGYFLAAQTFGNIPNPGGSQGVLCLGANVGRYSNFVTSSGSTGTIELNIDPTMMSQPTGSVPALAGQFWQFQLWHRDAVGGSSTSNFTNACTLAFQ